MNIKELSHFSKIKGITLLGTGDFTHPLWLEELKKNLAPLGNGFFEYDGTNFVLSSEISTIYSKKGKVRKVHHIILLPDFESVGRLNSELGKIGNLKADGRPILGLDSEKLAGIVFKICDRALLIPAHIWTPWFSLFGANSGFDRIENCYGEFTERIHALETGLSSDPEMNWKLSALDKFSLVSNSDSHSAWPWRIGREVNVFDKMDSYNCLYNTLKNKTGNFLFTVEFYPEEGKYHYDGHRSCGVCQHPKESIKTGNICPKCKRTLTIGVLHRVEELADRSEPVKPKNSPSFKKMVPLAEVISLVMGKAVGTKTVGEEYRRWTKELGNEFKIMLQVSDNKLREFDEKIGNVIIQMREGKIEFQQGFDGVYGKPILNLDKEKNSTLSKFF